MKFENAFTVPAPIEDTWTTLMDVERVAPCMPGAEVLERTGDNVYKVGIRVKVGPISMTYRGNVEITERDDGAHQATMRVKAREARGQGTADASVYMGLAEFADGSQAKIETDLQLSGRAASMGRGVIGDVAEKLIETFAGNLAEMLGSGGATVERPTVRPEAPAAEAAAAGAPPAEAPQPPPPSAQAPVTATAAEAPPPPRPTPPPPPAAAGPRPPKPSGGDSLNAAELAAGVIAGRLKNPRTLLVATGALGLAFGAIGYAIGRSR
jgi:carbon monoxide dehydrogenase subunit G